MTIDVKKESYEFDYFPKNEDGAYVWLFLRTIQNYANDLLRYNGHVFLYEILDLLEIEQVPDSKMVGWLLNGNGDGYIDFGIPLLLSDDILPNYPIHLTFNVDGDIHNLVNKEDQNDD